MTNDFSYSRKEKLKSRKQLESIFAKGKTFSAFPIKVFYQPVDAADHIVKAGVGVSARNFKKAVDRNRIKRLLRESYRLEKKVLHDFLESHPQPIAVFFLYVDKTLPDIALLREKMTAALSRLTKALNENHPANT